MKAIHWIIQSNLIREHVLAEIEAALTAGGISFEEVKIVPFSDELPEIKKLDEVNVFYGSTTLIMNAYRHYGVTKGIFYDAPNFNMRTYAERWGERMLNADARFLTFSEIVRLGLEEDSTWFVRPIEDDKAFSGRLMTVAEIHAFEKELATSNNPYLTTETIASISAPKAITKEWRLFVVDREMVSACRYTMDGKLSVDADDLPEEMLRFAEECCSMYVPAEVFVMDIALWEGQYRIVECNCFNDSGFYQHDIGGIIGRVNDWLYSRVMSSPDSREGI